VAGVSVPPPGSRRDLPASVAAEPVAQQGEQPGSGYVPRTKLLILGIVLTVWGLGIVLRGLANPPQGSSAYVSGQRLAIVLGLVMLVVGARQLWLEYRARRDATT
jgi:hypothetical protein